MERFSPDYEEALMSAAETVSLTLRLNAEALAKRYGYEEFDYDDYKRRLTAQYPEFSADDEEDSATQIINYLAYAKLMASRPNMSSFEPMAFASQIVVEYWPYPITQTQQRIGIEDERRLRLQSYDLNAQ